VGGAGAIGAGGGVPACLEKSFLKASNMSQARKLYPAGEGSSRKLSSGKDVCLTELRNCAKITQLRENGDGKGVMAEGGRKSKKYQRRRKWGPDI
jgi:hypothetical protein